MLIRIHAINWKERLAPFNVIATTKNVGYQIIAKTIVKIFSRQIDFKDFWGRTFVYGPNFLFYK